MADLLFIALLIGFFALSVLFVRACEKILGDDDGTVVEPSADDDVRVAA